MRWLLKKKSNHFEGRNLFVLFITLFLVHIVGDHSMHVDSLVT